MEDGVVEMSGMEACKLREQGMQGARSNWCAVRFII
jgi:hypothetical protein